MKRLFAAIVGLCLIATSAIAFYQSRDSNYNIAISGGGGGSVTVDATGTLAATGANTTKNYTGITVASGNALVCTLNFASDPGAITAVTWDSGGTNQALTVIPNTTATPAHGAGFVSIWGRTGGVTAGNKTLAVTWTNSVVSYINCISYSGANATFGTAFTGSNNISTGGTTTPSITITSATGHQVLGNFTDQSGNSITSIDHTTLGSIVNAVTTWENYSNGAASVTLGGVISPSTAWAYAGVDVSP